MCQSRCKSSHLYTYKTRSLSMDILIFLKAIHMIMSMQFKVHSVIIVYSWYNFLKKVEIWLGNHCS